MAYRIAGRATEICSCSVPCPCAFGQTPTGGTCKGMFVFEVSEGSVDGVSLAGTKAILLSTFSGPWTNGNFTAALILDANASQQQRDGLQRILTGALKGDAGQLAALVGDFKGVMVAPISYSYSGGKISVKAGDLLEASGETLKNVAGTAEIQISNACYPMPSVTAGKSARNRVRTDALTWDTPGTGMWTGSFELKG